MSEEQAKPENQVTNEELNNLRDQIRQRDEELKSRNAELDQERREKKEISSKLGTEVNQRFSAQESAIESQIVAATAEIDGLEKQQAQLMEEGKFADASKISRLIASAQYKLDGARTQKTQLDTYKNQATQEAERAKNDPLAAYSDPAKNWIKRNPAFLSDRKVNARVMAAHNMAVADDIEIDSQEYFTRLDEAINPQQRVTITPKEEELEDTQEAEPVKKPAPKSSTAAPVTRSGGQQQSNGGNGKRIQLTADEAEAALISFPKMTPQDAYVKYAENKKALKEAGRI
ncbi:MAG: hypothetical protein KGL39_53285 [Patescibacteria group bacterium]|nr:hypothetical protein [Patescibacteria group bacterium]